MKVAPISLLNLSASWSSWGLFKADLTAEVMMSLSLILLAGGLGRGGEVLAGGEEEVGGETGGGGGAGVQGSHFSMVTSPGSGSACWMRVELGPSGLLKPGWTGLSRNSLGVWVEKPGLLKADGECEGPAMKGRESGVGGPPESQGWKPACQPEEGSVQGVIRGGGGGGGPPRPCC